MLPILTLVEARSQGAPHKLLPITVIRSPTLIP